MLTERRTMTNQILFRTGIAILLLLTCPRVALCGELATSNAFPNIIYIMADDLGYGDLGCYGAEKISTPHIDQLADAGIRFTDAHSPSAVCTPTRYGVLTGRYCWRGRLKKEVLWSGYDRCLIEKGRRTIGNMMQAKGYKTAHIGKWHLGWEDEEPVDYTKGYLGRGPRELGFDYSFVTASAQNLYPIVFVENHKLVSKLKPMDYYVHNPKQKTIPPQEIHWHKTHANGPMTVAEDWEPYEVDRIFAEKAIGFITAHVQSTPEIPFYLHMTPETPHRPNIMPEFARGTSEAGMRGDHVQMLDWVVGQISGTLSNLDLESNTLVILTSDNGPKTAGVDGPTRGGPDQKFGHKSSGHLRGHKAQLWEGGHRVPFVARWPGRITPGRTSDSLICLTDMMATFASIIDYRLRDDMGEDSFNALPALLGNTEAIRESIIHHDFPGHFSIRRGAWKLAYGKLFHLEKDPGETHDVAGEHPEIVTELNGLLQKQIKAGKTAIRLM